MKIRAVDYQRARAVLRERRFQLQMRVRDLAEAAGVERTTIYHLEKIEKEPKHEPDFKTLEKLAGAMGLTLTDFFARIEGVTSPVRPSDQGSTANEGQYQGGRDVPASPVESDRLSRVEAEIANLKAQWGAVQNVAGRIVELAVTRAEGRATAGSAASRRRVSRKAL